MVRTLPIALAALLLGCPSTEELPCADADGLCLLAEELPEAFMSGRARADDDVWLVGSEVTPDSSGPSAIWWDGAAWNRVDASACVLRLLEHDEEAHAKLLRQDRMVQLGNMTASVAHDLNNP